MQPTMDDDVPSPIDFLRIDHAREWEGNAMARPFRMDFFTAISAELERTVPADASILELGSGPGFLAQHLLTQLPRVTLHLLDYSAAMHTLAQARLANFSGRVTYVERSFREEGWGDGLGSFDAVVSVQAIHELRHKRYAAALHRAVKGLLAPGGEYLVCDHYFGDDAMRDNRLYMSIAEQQACLEDAGFEVTTLLVKGGRTLLRAVPARQVC